MNYEIDTHRKASGTVPVPVVCLFLSSQLHGPKNEIPAPSPAWLNARVRKRSLIAIVPP